MAQTYNLYWHRQKIGTFTQEGAKLAWNGYAPGFEDTFTKRPSDGMPNFLAFLLPQGWLEDVLNKPDQGDYVAQGRHYLSNLCIQPEGAEAEASLPLDRLEGRIADFRHKGVFSGRNALRLPHVLSREFNAAAAHYWENPQMPRFSGAVPKIPVNLSPDGVLNAATDKSFTHILKLPGDEKRDYMCVNEWICLQLSKAIGLETADCALVSLHADEAPALLVERFDIPVAGAETDTMQIVQDFVTLAPYSDSPYKMEEGSHEQVAKTLLQHSTSPREDAIALFKRVILEQATQDNDMHRKNVSMIVTCDSGGTILSKRFAPTYDASSAVFSEDGERRLKMPLGGTNKDVSRKKMLEYALMLGIEKQEAATIMTDCLTRIAETAQDIAAHLPAAAQRHEGCVYAAEKIAEITTKTAQKMGCALDSYKEVRRPESVQKIGREVLVQKRQWDLV